MDALSRAMMAQIREEGHEREKVSTGETKNQKLLRHCFWLPSVELHIYACSAVKTLSEHPKGTLPCE